MSAPGTNKVDVEVRPDGVALVTLDHFPLNTLSNAIQLGLEDAATQIAADKNVKAVVVKGAGSRAFCAGADVVDLNKKHARTPTKPFTQCFEPLNVPVVAAIQGFALGGGLELALSCHYRVIAKNGAVGLPEVNIGLLPGGEGTQRLPRVMGAKGAMDLMLSGGHAPAAAAKKLGVVDDIFEHAELIDKASAFALQMAKENPSNKGRKISEMPNPTAEPGLFDKARSQMKAKRRGQPAPLAIIDCVEAACSQPFNKGLEIERKLFLGLLGGKEANALQHVFFAERGAAKIPGLTAKPANVKKVALIGAGLMAGGIAMTFANRGIKVVLLDREQQYCEKGLAVIKSNYQRSVKRGSKSQATVDRAMSMFSLTTSYDDLKDVDLVIEAVFEDMVLKKEIFQKLDAVCKPGCILATNTSFLSIDEMASVTKRPEDVIGMHYFSPANIMPLLENVRGAKTSERAIATAMAVGAKTGKWPVLVGNCHGFVANRMMENYGVCSRKMLIDGNKSYEYIDKIATNMGMPMGPFAMGDLTGLAIGMEARKRNGTFDPETIIGDYLVENGRLGMKSGAGFYDYKGGKRAVNNDVMEKVKEIRAKVGSKSVDLTDQEIFEQLFYPAINEGFKILEEGFAVRPADIDVVLVHGYNWPRVTGGPMHMADDIGLDKILQALQKYQAVDSAKYFVPSQLLIDCVNANQKLSQFWAKNSAKYSNNSAKL
mmetsp:Transcript_14273/g.25577  ORF Transcript_14273/g.25577 Transcript_14273/m.25577 type:complete len:713 (+) Transcript_14273:116-2254(+)